jgi:glycosyltransferase involved in cell wall biosynthesis
MGQLVSSGAVQPTFLLRGGGELIEDYRSLGPVEIVARTGSFVRRGARALGVERAYQVAFDAAVGAQLRRRAAAMDLVYVNTVAHADLLPLLGTTGIPILCQVHEMGRFMDRSLSDVALERLRRHVSAFVAVSDPVRQALLERGVGVGAIEVIPGIVGPGAVIDAAKRAEVRERAFALRPGERLVVGCGVPTWTKGTDLFVAVCARLRTLAESELVPRVRAGWIGADDAMPDGRLLREDLDRAGLLGDVALIGEVPDASALLGAADVFLSTSREDSMPLSVLEAAANGVPVVCFAGSGGAGDVAAAGGGRTAPYFDIVAFADEVASLLASPEDAARMGRAAQAFVRERCSPERVGAETLALFDRLLEKQR